jgi:hypothetical protein
MSQQRQKRIDTTIVIAVIGLCGTLAAALLSSPVLLRLLDRTPATATFLPGTATPETATPTNFPLQTATTAPGPTDTSRPSPVASLTPLPTPGQAVLVFSEDFDDNTASGFGFSNGQWVISKYHGNPGLEGKADSAGAPARAVFGPSDFSNGAIEFQAKFKASGGLLLNFRDDDTQTYSLYLSPTDDELTLGYSSAAGNWQLEPLPGANRRPFTFEEGVWYTVRVEVSGGQMTVWVDGNRLMSSSDSRLTQGYLEFAIQYPEVVALDNIKVWDAGP